MEDGTGAPALVPRLCHIVRWSDFNGYGFNLHAEKGKAGQFIGKVDPGSPAEAAGLRQGDRIVEVNGINIGNENHQQVVGRIKSGGDETRLLVVDAETDMHYKNSITVVRGDLPEVRFITAARDDNIKPTPVPDTNGIAAPTAASEPPAAGDRATTAASPHYPVRLCQLRKWVDFDGYGFNLHAEKDKPGQFIGAVDADSPAERGGLKEGDRIVEVNGENIESLTHAGVIQRVKAGGDRTELLVVDREADDYYKGLGATVSGGMTGVTVLATPATSKMMADVDINSNEQSSEPVTSYPNLTPPEEPTPDSSQLEKPEEAEVAHAAEAEVTSAHAAEAEVTNVDDVNLSTLPEPNVSLSDEESEPITAVTAETVESAPEPPRDEEPVPNGNEVEKEEKEEKEEEEEKKQEEEVVMATEVVTQAAVVDEVVAVEEKREEAEEEEKEVAEEEGAAIFNDYEQVEVTAAVPAFSSPPVDEDLGPTSYGMNGGSEVPEPEPARAEPEPRPVAPEPVRPEPLPAAKAPEPEPAVIRSTLPSNAAPGSDGGLSLHMSAAEMKERLKARKKQDPRFSKTSFEAKSKMFEKL